MKKKNLKSLSLKKASVSKLNGGIALPTPIQQTRKLEECLITQDIFNCTWVSELYTACGCQLSWDFGCNTEAIVGCIPA